MLCEFAEIEGVNGRSDISNSYSIVTKRTHRKRNSCSNCFYSINHSVMSEY